MRFVISIWLTSARAWYDYVSSIGLIITSAIAVISVIQLRRQAKATEIQAKATEAAATAAKDNAEYLMNAERAWVMVDIDWNGGLVDTMEESYTSIFCVCRNEGKSIAWITEKWLDVKMMNVIPSTPDFADAKNIFQHAVQPLAPGKGDSCDLKPSVPRPESRRNGVLIYGYVRYRTIFEREGETRFGYMLTPMCNLERLPAEYPEYNKNT